MIHLRQGKIMKAILIAGLLWVALAASSESPELASTNDPGRAVPGASSSAVAAAQTAPLRQSGDYNAVPNAARASAVPVNKSYCPGYDGPSIVPQAARKIMI
jgi:hypothetical protein